MESKAPIEHADHLSGLPLVIALAINLLLTLVEAAGGIAAGSLALLSDALHNFSDCGSLLVALVAQRVARRPADERRTFGYRRAEVIGALINLTILIVISVYILGDAAWRLLQPRTVEGTVVIVIAAVALVIDLLTTALLYASSGRSINIRAALVHNLSDAIASLGVIVAGACIFLWNINVIDVLVSLLIAGYILWQSLPMFSRCIAILMESVPTDIEIEPLMRRIQDVDHVLEVHHVHVWHLDETRLAMEAHIVIHPRSIQDMQQTKAAIKELLQETFGVTHSTLEFEFPGECEQDSENSIHANCS